MKHYKNTITKTILLFLLIIFFTVSCDEDINRVKDHNKDCKINIGFLSAQTGGASHFGLPAYYAYQYAVNDLNKYYG